MHELDALANAIGTLERLVDGAGVVVLLFGQVGQDLFHGRGIGVHVHVRCSMRVKIAP